MLINPEVFALTLPFGIVLICLIIDSSRLGRLKVVGISIRILLGMLGVVGFVVAFTGMNYFGLLLGSFGASALSASMLGMIVVNNIKIMRSGEI